MSHLDQRRVRPSLLLLTCLFLAGAGFVVYQAGQHSALDSYATQAEDAQRTTRRAGDGRTGPDRRGAGRHASSGGGGGYVHHDWGTETALARSLALGLPGPSFWRDSAERGAPAQDPQLAAMWMSFRAQATNPEEAPPLPFEPTAHRAQLIDSEGDVEANPTSCDVRILPVQSGGFNCVVRVMCDGRVLYPNDNQTAGYVPCDVENGRPVRAVDEGNTARDGDPLVNLDIAAGTVTVEDFHPDGARRYRATLRIGG